MPHEMNEDANGRGIVISLLGAIEAAEIFKLNELLMANESFTRWCYQIWDFTKVSRFDVSLDQIRDFAIQDSVAAQKNPNQKIAIILRHPRIGLDRTFHIMEEIWGGYKSRSFTDIDAAREWINQDSD